MDKEELKKVFNKEINEVIALDNKSYNIFSILGYNSRELKHSRFMRWLLSFDAFFERFTKACGIKVSSNMPRKINLEETYHTNTLKDENIPISKNNYLENNDYRHIDMNIIGGDFSITIENKVDTGEHDDQCISYYNYMMDKNGKYNYIKDPNKFFVFLSKKEQKDFSDFGGLMPKPNVKKDVDSDDKYLRHREYDGEHKVSEYIEAFDKTGRKMKFFNYRLITYKDVLGILEDKAFIEDLKNEIKDKDWFFVQKLLEQFTHTVEEWDKLGEDYISIFDNILRDKDKEQAFYNDIIKNLKSLKEDESDLGRFVEVASDYYDELKQKTDNYIKSALEAIISDNITLKTDYDEKYAYAIPIAIDYVGDEDRMRFICDKKIISDDDKKLQLRDWFYKYKEIDAQKERNKRERKKSKDKTEIKLDPESEKCWQGYRKEIAGYLKEIKESECQYWGFPPNKYKDLLDNFMLQSVDFRAPMGDSKYITIGISAGLFVNFSKKLCDYVLTDGFKKKYDNFKAHTENVKLTWTYKVKNGSNFNDERHKIYEADVNFDEFLKYFSKPDNDAESYVCATYSSKKEELFNRIQELGKNNIFDNKRAAKELKDSISNYFDKGKKKVNCQWIMGITFELKDFPDKNGKINAQALAEQFYKTTIEGMKLLGYDEYFKKQIFKPDAERRKAIESLKNEE